MQTHVNFGVAKVTVAPAPAKTGTSLTIENIVLPTLPCKMSVFPSKEPPTEANAELVEVTADAAGKLTVVRGKEGSTARAIEANDYVIVGTLSAAEIEELREWLEGEPNVATIAANTTLTGTRATRFCDVSGGSITVTLPEITRAGMVFKIGLVTETAGANTAKVKRKGANTIEGKTEVALAAEEGDYSDTFISSDDLATWRRI